MSKPETDPVFDAIFDFNERVINLPESIALNPLTDNQYDWTQKFCREELAEFEEAYRTQNIVDMVDAILDLVYGALGTLKKMGLTREQAYACMMEVHRANMTKKRGVVERRGSQEDATKPVEFVPPNEAMAKILFGDDQE